MVAIYFDPEGYTTSGPKLMGRNAAGEAFLRGFIKYSSQEQFVLAVESAEADLVFKEAQRRYGVNKPLKLISPTNYGAHAKSGELYFPSPGIGQLAYKRAAFGHRSWSLSGITHTTSSAGAMDSLAELITAPVMEWDAVICTSTAVKNNVLNVLQAQLDYFKERFGITKFVQPQLPVIPLGIHTEDFVFTGEQKASARRSLNIHPDAIVVIYMGRLSFHAKAHPLSMYQALQQATEKTQKEVVLIECGWHANDKIAESFREGAKLVSPDLRVITLDGREKSKRDMAWGAADIFCSFSDNIQETFGITPIEGMAAGLPVVVSDWDGYKDTVRDQVDGFRIPTTIPPAGVGGDLALRHALGALTYDRYCGYSCALVEIDIEAATQAFIALINDPGLRTEMGLAGQKRAKTIYDWKHIIPMYEQLWEELEAIRQSDPHNPPSPWPARLDPFTSFSHYATQTLSEHTLVSLNKSPEVTIEAWQSMLQLDMVNYASYVLPTEKVMAQIVSTLGTNTIAIGQILEGIHPSSRTAVLRSMGALLKFGLIRRLK